MYKALLAVLLAIVLALAIVTGWFMVFNFQALPELGREFVRIIESAEYWIGLGVFSAAFFLFFTLPLSLILIKE